VAYADSQLGSVHIVGDGIHVKLLYGKCTLPIGTTVVANDSIIGVCQDVAAYHAKPGRTMQNHIHMECKVNGSLVDPSTLMKLPVTP
jgi:hypothetical protein